MCKLFYVYNGMSYGVLKMDYQTNREVMKCDMCISTEQNFPQCVDKCPMNALTLEEVDE